MNVNIYPKGDALHISGYAVDPILLREGVARDFTFGLSKLDWDCLVDDVEIALTSHFPVVSNKIAPPAPLLKFRLQNALYPYAY